MFAATAAQKRGYAQVLWLDALEHRYCEEVGVMNLFVQFKDEIVTAPLGGTILAGVTRDSVITLLRDWGYTVNERRYAFDEVLEAKKNGTLGEVFGTGTAAVISPVGEFGYNEGSPPDLRWLHRPAGPAALLDADLDSVRRWRRTRTAGPKK